jgi:branched-chain amino acid transport system ATP-binding protein
MSLLELDRVTVAYGAVVAVRELSLTVERGEIVALLGANGAGKTTTLRAVSGLARLRSGRVVVDGTDVSGARAEDIARRGVAHVPAGRGIFASLSVRDNLLMGMYGAGSDASERIDEAFAMFPVLAEKRRQPAGELSGGQQQQLAIGRALVQKPRLLLLDEMSMGLAPAVVADLFALVERLRDDGMAVLLVEQFVTEALRVADRAVVLEQGVVVAEGPAAELGDDAVAAAYLGGGASGSRPGAAGAGSSARETLTAQLAGRTVRALERTAQREGVGVDALVDDAVRRLLEGKP